MAKSTEIARREASQVPAYIKQDDTRGKENITSKDIRFPALKLAQAMSNEVKRTEAEYIDGLREGEFFNSVTKDIYGEDPVRFVVIHYNGRRNIEFDPVDRRKVIDGNVADTDERCDFREVVENGQKVRKPPVATTFKDFVILATINGEQQVMTLSFKKTQLKRATDILSRLEAAKRLPAFALAWTATPVSQRTPKGTFYGFQVQPDGYATEAEYELGSKLYDQLQGKTVTVDDTDATDAPEGRQPGDEDEIPY